MKGMFVSAAAAFLMMLFSCSGPSSEEQFVKFGDRADGRYVFSADMSDSLSVYDMSLYTRIDCSRREFASEGDIRTEILLVSPSGKEYGETVYLCRSAFTTSDSLSWEFMQDYRSGIHPSEFGIWTVSVRIPEDESIPGFRGLGLILSRH